MRGGGVTTYLRKKGRTKGISLYGEFLVELGFEPRTFPLVPWLLEASIRTKFPWKHLGGKEKEVQFRY